MLNPIQQTSMLNQEMKNPHLVETMVTVEPITGKRIQTGYDHHSWITEVDGETPEWRTYVEKMTGNIPKIEVTFNIQGIPLVLTAQSYLVIRLTPKLTQEPITVDNLFGSPLETDFEIYRGGWPKLNSQVIDRVQATISNMGTEAYYGFYLNYIRSLKLATEIRENMSRQYNNNFCSSTISYLFAGQNHVNYTSTNYLQRDEGEYLFACSIERLGIKTIKWTKDNTFELKIPLSEILPLFQTPVIPLAQTNTSGVQLRMILYSPRHLFFISRSFQTNLIWNDEGQNTMNTFGLTEGTTILTGIPTSLMQTVIQQTQPNEPVGQYVQSTQIGGTTTASLLTPPTATQTVTGAGVLTQAQNVSTNRTLLGYDRTLLEQLPPKTIVEAKDNNFFACDLDVDVFLNLKVLSNPLLNPLAEAYIQPFINEMNEFRSKFETSALFNQTIKLLPNIPTSFRFTPSRLFYNATQIGLFFFTNTSQWEGEIDDAALNVIRTNTFSRSFNRNYLELALKAGPIHGYYSLPPTVDIYDFQIGLSSSATPLFDRPLDKVGMLGATEDCFKKYNPTEMYGKVIQNRKRLSEGDAFFLFDLTHTRDSGYFIDADNMITVGGTLKYNYAQTQDNISADSLEVQVIMVVFYQETFTVLLDLEGAVLFQQT